ncbi:GyrI-like domain-containing protein [Chitinispirillales bacterium ANBcel5]|uniref:hydrolase n=1 Tax=Cellulosispirillum alkaliphilum TaxID=3039283 RepID=UPI002A521E7F|nr:GyrI-like domain-containing protein [Chitinispirillales bacterium ANBcel5]
MVSEFKVEEIPEQPALSISTKCSSEQLPDVLGSAYSKIQDTLKKAGEEVAGAPYVIYYTMDMQNLDIEIGMPVKREVLGVNEVEAKMTLSGKAATCVYKGPYKNIESAYNELAEFVKNEGLRPKGIACEMYLNNPMEVSPEDLLTKLSFPLK